MAKKVKINYVKSKIVSGQNTFVVRVRYKLDITPDEWVWVDTGIPDAKLYYKAESDPEVGVDTPIEPYKTKKGTNYTWYYFRISGVTPGLDYHIFAGSLTQGDKFLKSSVTVERFVLSTVGAPMLMVYAFDGWQDFTSCIPVPDYKVNMTDITEEWDDANYNTHSSVVQQRIKGSFDLRFPDKSKLNTFLACLKFNENKYGKGRVKMKVQVNNELDLDDVTVLNQTDIDNALPMMYTDFFKISWDPDWSLPFYGTSNDYSAMSVNIEEIEEEEE